MRSLVLASLFLLGCPSAPQTIALSADRTSALANGTDQVTITATTGSPDTVSFSADGGQLSAASVKTDDAGVATTKLSATTAGSVLVTASAGSATASTTVTFTTASGPHLRFRVSPSNTMAQNLLRPVPEVVVEDGSGIVTSSSVGDGGDHSGVLRGRARCVEPDDGERGVGGGELLRAQEQHRGERVHAHRDEPLDDSGRVSGVRHSVMR